MSSLAKYLFRSATHILIALFFVFVFFILSYMNYFYILEMNFLSVASFANIFSYCEGGFCIAGNVVFPDLSGCDMTVFILSKSIHLKFMASLCDWRTKCS